MSWFLTCLLYREISCLTLSWLLGDFTYGGGWMDGTFYLNQYLTINDRSLGEQRILFSSNLNVSLDFVSGNTEIRGKQNSLFPKGPVVK